MEKEGEWVRIALSLAPLVGEEILTDAMFTFPGSDETKLNITKSYAEDKLSRTFIKRLKAVS